MDSELKQEADALFCRIRHESVHRLQHLRPSDTPEGRIPFDISLNKPNKETIAAMLEAERIAHDPTVKGYTDLDELFADLKK